MDTEKLKQLGIWWCDPWWLGAEWLDAAGLSRQYVEDSFEYLKEIFPQKWVEKYNGELVENVLLRNVFIGKSIFQLNNMVGLSRSLRSLQGTAGINQVINNLKSSDMSDSAYLELDIGYAFKSIGYDVSFPIPGGKKGRTPDIVVQVDGEFLAVECKKLSISRFESYSDGLLWNLSIRMMSEVEKIRYAVLYEVDENIFTKIKFFYKNKYVVSDAVSELVGDYRDTVNRLSKKEYQWLLSQHSLLGVGYFFQCDNPTRSRVMTPDFPEEFKTSRLMSNGIERALKQLKHLDTPGMVAVHVRAVPDSVYLSDFLDKFFFENSSQFENVIGVIVFPWLNRFKWENPCFVINKHSSFDVGKLKVFEDIKTIYDPILS